MNTMDCTDIKALLSAIVDDELDDARRHAAERHLADCADCRTLIDETEALNDLIVQDAGAGASGSSLPADFEQRVLAETVHRDGVRMRRYRMSMWTAWLATAASITVASVVWLDGRSQPDGGSDSLARRDFESATDPFSPSQAMNRHRHVRPATYTTGIDLRSQTFEGGLPAEAFRVQHAALTDLTLPYDPVFPQPETDAAASFAEPGDELRLAQEDADTLYSAALLIDMFSDADLQSFSEVERIRQVIELDDLLPRLSRTRERLADADRPIVFAAESVLLRIAHGPLDRDDAAALQDTVERMSLAATVETMSER